MSKSARSIVVYILAGVVPAAYYVVTAQLFPSGGSEVPVKALAVKAFFLLFLSNLAAAPFGFVLGRRANAALIAFSALAGICLGVIVNAEYDSNAHDIDHNLIPFEIVLAPFLIMPGMLCGLAATVWPITWKRKE